MRFDRTLAAALLCAVSLSLICLCMSCPQTVLAEGADDLLTEDVLLPDTADFPELNASGFLDEGEFIYQDDAAGIWRYCSETLRIAIDRRTSDKPKLMWYEAEIWAAKGELFHMIAHNPASRMKSLQYPYRIAREHQTVFALNGDFAHMRISKKMKVGILLRDGQILSSRTYAHNKGPFPNLDNLALYPDGRMEVAWSDEHTAQEYADMGATDVLAFGPVLVRNGEMNSAALKKYASSKAQRVGIGMVEPGHYIAVLAEGRTKDAKGTDIAWLADKMRELGCVNAFNLDGGQSACMVFLGKQINQDLNKLGNRASARKAAEILGIGTSQAVADENDPF